MWHLLGIQVMGMTTRVETADELERRHQRRSVSG